MYNVGNRQKRGAQRHRGKGGGGGGGGGLLDDRRDRRGGGTRGSFAGGNNNEGSGAMQRALRASFANGNGNEGSGAIQQAISINAALCRAADHSDVQGLLDLVAMRLGDMSCVNLSTAMHKLARIAKEEGRVVPAGDARMVALHVRTQLELESQLAIGPEAEVLPRCWATIAWAYGTLQVPGLEVGHVFQVIGELALPHLNAFKPFELTNLLWGFAKTQVPSARLFQTASRIIKANLSAFSPSNLSALVWAFVTASYCHASMLHQIAEEFAARLSGAEVNPVELVNLIWGLATAKLRPKPHVLEEVGGRAKQLLLEFKLNELSITAWAFSRLGARHDQFFAATAQRLCSSPQLRQQVHPQGIANLLWAFEKQKAMGSTAIMHIMTAVYTLLPVCQHLLPQLKQEEFACIFRALSKLGLHWGTYAEADALFFSGARVGISFLSTFPLSQCMDLMEAFTSFLYSGNRTVPPPIIAFITALIFTQFRKVDELEPLAARHFVTVVATSTSLLGQENDQIKGMVAALALQLRLEQFSAAGLTQLAVMAGCTKRDLDLGKLRTILEQMAAASYPNTQGNWVPPGGPQGRAPYPHHKAAGAPPSASPPQFAEQPIPCPPSSRFVPQQHAQDRQDRQDGKGKGGSAGMYPAARMGQFPGKAGGGGGGGVGGGGGGGKQHHDAQPPQDLYHDMPVDFEEQMEQTEPGDDADSSGDTAGRQIPIPRFMSREPTLDLQENNTGKAGRAVFADVQVPPSSYVVKNTFIESAEADKELSRLRLSASSFCSEQPRASMSWASDVNAAAYSSAPPSPPRLLTAPPPPRVHRHTLKPLMEIPGFEVPPRSDGVAPDYTLNADTSVAEEATEETNAEKEDNMAAGYDAAEASTSVELAPEPGPFIQVPAAAQKGPSPSWAASTSSSPTAAYTVKNTFIEPTEADNGAAPARLSAVIFRSEQPRRRSHDETVEIKNPPVVVEDVCSGDTNMHSDELAIDEPAYIVKTFVENESEADVATMRPRLGMPE